MDGGSVTAPRVAFYDRNGQWDVENHGVDPDVEEEITPHDFMTGHDPQLERAVDLVLKQLDEHPQQWPKHPAFPNYHMQTAGKPGSLPAKSGNTP